MFFKLQSRIPQGLSMADVVTILAIDGGGIRGVIPALVLEKIEAETKKPIADLFDLIIGTSTGGIIGLGLTAPSDAQRPLCSAADIVNFYETQGEKIFSRSVTDRIGSLWGANGSVYPAEPIEEILQRYFAKIRLKDALTEVIVTSYDIERRNPYFFKSFRARQRPDRDCYMWQAARATSAAPWYFPPYKLERTPPNDYLALIDGGVFVNNPAMAGYMEAQTLTKSTPGTEYLIVSLGTGQLTRRLPYEEVVDWGARGWLGPVLDIVFDGTSSAIDYQMQLLFGEPRNPARYYRFQCHLTHARDEMDLATKDNLKALRDQAWIMTNSDSHRLNELCRRLLEISEGRAIRKWRLLGDATQASIP